MNHNDIIYLFLSVIKSSGKVIVLVLVLVEKSIYLSYGVLERNALGKDFLLKEKKTFLRSARHFVLSDFISAITSIAAKSFQVLGSRYLSI